MRALNRPTAKQARDLGATAWRNGSSQLANPYTKGFDRRCPKWWVQGWMAAATDKKDLR